MNIQEASEVTGHSPQHFPYLSADWDDADLCFAMRTDVNVLLTGPADVALAAARRIHSESGWRHGRFVMIDCSNPHELDRRLTDAFGEDEELVEEPSARLIQAGTVLLYEVGRTPVSVQELLDAKLTDLRKRRRSRCRVLACSSECLTRKILDGTFKERLFYRLNVIHVRVGTAHR